MTLQNYANNFFYSVQFSFEHEGVDPDIMERYDPTPPWFLEWWNIYGLSPWVIKPYALHLLDIPGFTIAHEHQRGILYKTVIDISTIEDLTFLQSTRRCGHI